MSEEKLEELSMLATRIQILSFGLIDDLTPLLPTSPKTKEDFGKIYEFARRQEFLLELMYSIRDIAEKQSKIIGL